MKELQPIVTSSTTSAGELYFYNANTFLNPEELQSVLNSVIENYNEIGIRFKHASICKKDQFPKLNGLDMLLYALDGDDNLLNGSCGQYGIYYNYIDFKKIVNTPYDKITSKTNTGFFATEYNIIWLRKFYGKFYGNFSKEDILKATEEIATHEIGHGLGACHVVYNNYHFTRNRDYFVGDTNLRKKQAFHPDNVKQMKQFIETVNIHNLSPEKVCELREKYLGNYIFTS